MTLYGLKIGVIPLPVAALIPEALLAMFLYNDPWLGSPMAEPTMSGIILYAELIILAADCPAQLYGFMPIESAKAIAALNMRSSLGMPGRDIMARERFLRIIASSPSLDEPYPAPVAVWNIFVSMSVTSVNYII
jgi:hypothetical protein